MKPILVALLLLVLASVAYFALREGEAPTPGDEVPPPVAAAPTEAPSESVLVPRGDAPRGETTREEAKESPYATPPREGILVRVVDGLTNEPVSDAEVWALPALDLPPGSSPTLGEWTGLLAFGPGRATSLADSPCYLADARGHVLVPDTARPLRVAASDEGRWGLRVLHAAEATELVLALYPDAPLVVRVVDEGGRACADMPVAYLLEEPFWDALVTTGADGTVEIPHGLALARSLGTKRTLVALRTPLPRRVWEELDPAAPPRGPITLTLPATGFLEVTVVLGPGVAPPGSVEVVVTTNPTWSLPRESDLPRSLDSTAQRTLRHDMHPDAGPLVVPVGLGLDFHLTAAAPARKLGPVGGRLVGPTRSGETVAMVLTLVPVETYLVGRILDEAGTPLGPSPWSGTCVRKQSNGRFSRPVSLATDAAGRFRLKLRNTERASPGATTLRLTRQASEQAPAMEAEGLLDQPLGAGENDMGDLVGRPLAPLAQGRVVDTAGTPLPAARVFLLENRHLDQFGRPFFRRPPPRLETTSDLAGTFVLHGAPGAEGPMALNAAKEGFADCPPLRVQGGEVGLELVLPREGGIAGFVLTDTDEIRELLSVQLFEGQEHVDQYLARRTNCSRAEHLDREGRFALAPLRPGLYTVLVSFNDLDNGIEFIQGIVVREGETTVDPRLQGIDLRGRVHLFTVRVLDPEGEEVGATVSARPSNDPAGQEYVEVSMSPFMPLVIKSKHDLLDVTVRATGCRTQVVRAVAPGESTVQMQRGFPVELVLEDPSVLPAEGFALRAALSKVGAPSRAKLWRDFSPAGSLTVLVPEPGSYVVDLSVHGVGRQGAQDSYPVALDGIPIEVRESDNPPLFPLAVPHAAVEAARARFTNGR